MINKVILIGRVGKNPEVRHTKAGDMVTTFSLATHETWKDKNGEKQERTEWHNLVLYRKLAEIARDYISKGSQIYVEGKLQTDKWKDKNGQDRYTTSIIVNNMQMLGGKPVGNGHPGASERSSPRHGSMDTDMDDFDDGVPF